jgi:hypothetical protein
MAHALQVYLEDSDFRALEVWAQQRGWTLSQAVRVALKALTRSGSDEDPLLAASGMIEGLPADLSSRFDSFLQATYVAEPPPQYSHAKPRRRAKKPVRR